LNDPAKCGYTTPSAPEDLKNLPEKSAYRGRRSLTFSIDPEVWLFCELSGPRSSGPPALYIKSGLKWQSGLNYGIFTFWPVRGNRSYWGTFDPIFSDYGYTGLESEIASFEGRKTGLIIPFWLVDRRSDGLE
jgi:hypothetical protein